FTFPVIAFISAGSVNFFFPAGGGHWAMQGPIMIGAALDSGADTAQTAVAGAWGAASTTTIQTCWALPLVARAGLKVRAIMGLCGTILLWSVIPISLGLLFF